MIKYFPRYLAGAGLTLVFSGIVLSLRRIDLWREHYSDIGQVYALSNSLKLLLFAMVCWLLYAVGNYVVGKFRAENATQHCIIAMLCGIGVVSLVMFILGVLHIMFFQVVFLPAALLTFLSGQLFSDALGSSCRRISAYFTNNFFETTVSVALWTLAGVLFCYVALAKGIYPDVITMDTVSSYMPFFRDSVSAGGLSIAPWAYNYLTSRGAGLALFFVVLTDEQSLQLASLLSILLICIILVDTVRNTTRGSSCLAAAAVIVFLAIPDIFRLEFQKQHALVAGLIFGQWYVLVHLFNNDDRSTPLYVVGIINAVSLTVLLPSAALAVAAPMTILAFAAALWKKRPNRGLVFSLLVITLVAPLALWAVSYFALGLADLNPPHFFFSLRNDTTLSKYVDVNVVRLFCTLSDYDGHIASSASFLTTRLFQVNPLQYWWSRQLPSLWLLGCLVIPALWLVRRSKAVDRKTLVMGGGAFCILFLAYVLNLVVKQASFGLSRLGFFVYAPMILLYSMAVGLVCLAVKDRLALKKPTGLLPFLAAAAMIVFALLRYPHNLGDDVRETMEFFSGKAGYAQRYGRVHREIPACLAFMDITGSAPVFPLNYTAGCYGMPAGTFRPPFFDTNDINFTALLRGDATSQERLLLENDRSYFTVDLSVPPTPYLYLPVFSPENIRQHFRIVSTYGPDTFLLKMGETGDVAAMQVFLDRYALYHDTHANEGRGRVMNSFLIEN